MTSAPEPAAFSGSYDPADVTFLLTVEDIASVPVAEKEQLIQSGERHYSEMLSAEHPPDPEYLELYHVALTMNGARMARDVARLARALAQRSGTDGLTLVSLARAGTPVGVLLSRALGALGHDAVHYSVSIIRDRGIDERALDVVCQRHDPASVVFVDGWTGKGAIARELERAADAYAAHRGIRLNPALVVLSDLAGVAGLAATSDDYLIPSAILNAVVSGLVSRTVLHRGAVDGFHACRYYHEMAAHDLSRTFVDELRPLVEAALVADHVAPGGWDEARRPLLQRTSDAFVRDTLARYGARDPNRVKPGIGEATRALLRRVPERLLLQSTEGADVQHLLVLAKRAGVPINICPNIPYRAATLIRTLGTD